MFGVQGSKAGWASKFVEFVVSPPCVRRLAVSFDSQHRLTSPTRVPCLRLDLMDGGRTLKTSFEPGR